MTDPHRTNALVTSCLKTPVDPHRKTPLALYERHGVLPLAGENMDNEEEEEEEEEEEMEDWEHDEEEREGVRFGPDYSARGEGDHLQLREIFFSNQEYYGKLEELKRAHLRTMAELEDMYRKKLQLSGLASQPDPPDPSMQSRFLCADPSSEMSYGLRKACSAMELRRGSGLSSDEEEGAEEKGARQRMEKGLSSSPKEHIKSMWLDFKLYPRQSSSSSLRSLSGGGGGGARKGKKNSKKRSHQGEEDAKQESWRHRVTVPQPFQMTRREAGRRQSGVKTRSEVELENVELRRQLDELGECQRRFRASPVPAHVRLPLYEELQEQAKREREEQQREQNLRIAPKPFSFLERERRRKEQREQQPRLLQPSSPQEVKPFRARPVPRAVYAAAAGDRVKEEQLYRSIKTQMRAKELLHSAALPPSMLARSLSQPKSTRDPGAAEGGFSHRPKINVDVPDFNARHRLFKQRLESRREVRPVTSCEPFTLRTSQMASHRDRGAAEKEQGSPRPTRWPYVTPRALHTPSSSLCSSLSGSLELLPAKVTDASKKRQEAVRKTLEEKRRAEEEEEKEREKRRRRERRLQKEVLQRAQANDPHRALSQTCPAKLREFRKQDLQRKREYQQEIKEIQERVKERPLLLERVAQRNAKTAVERRYTEALRGCGLTENFLSGTGNGSPRSARKTSNSSRSSCQSDSPVGCRKSFLDVQRLGSELAGAEVAHGQEEEEEEEKEKGKRLGRSHEEDSSHSADERYSYSDDQENFSDGQETHSDNSEEHGEQQEEVEENTDRTSLHVENSNTLNKASDEEN